MNTQISAGSSTRYELHELLVDQRDRLDELVKLVADPTIAAERLVDMVEVLERIDDRRDELILQLRREASGARRREEERSIRQFVLQALDEIGMPQNSGFLEEYLWAHDRVDVSTRAFGALRRDERRAWDRNPGKRKAYIVPALHPDGQPGSRWMARSDWPLETRVIVLPDDERLLDLSKLRALLKAAHEQDRADPSDPFEPLIEKYASELLDHEPPSVEGRGRRRWFADIRGEVDAEMDKLRSATAARRRQDAAQLARQPDEAKLWGSES